MVKLPLASFQDTVVGKQVHYFQDSYERTWMAFIRGLGFEFV